MSPSAIIFYQLALLTGMRRSELAGLQWASVNLATGRLSVVKTLQRISGHDLVEGQSKTADRDNQVHFGEPFGFLE